MTGAVQGVIPANMEAVVKIDGPNAAESRTGTNNFAINSDDVKEFTAPSGPWHRADGPEDCASLLMNR